MSRQIDRMKELIRLLNRAGRAYYQDDREIMPNIVYDSLYDELAALESETGVVMADSPTVSVGYEAVDELPKEQHESPMLSLNKTKSTEELAQWLGSHTALMSWKLDGLTIVLTYQDGHLSKAVTRGNGEVGEVITNNARVFSNVPLSIPFKGNLVLRGEAVIHYSDFDKINEELDETAKYKNPRNLCSGTVRQLDNRITAARNVHFYAFSLVNAQDVEFDNSREHQFEWLKKQGFEVVEYRKVTGAGVDETVQWFADRIKHFDVPSDGLVLLLDDIAYGESLGRTAKFPRNAIAFKWADEKAQTRLVDIEWNTSRTGLINPVAVFEPVELEGTSVSRASVHNVSIVRELKLGAGDVLEVYKANMIIPQIAQNLTGSGSCVIPDKCPVCGHASEIVENQEVQYLYCMNKDCPARKVRAYTLLVSRDALNIEGLSAATLEKFMEAGYIKEFADIFKLDEYRDEIVEMEGFGEKSYANLMDNINAARDTTLARFLVAIGIPNIGTVNAKVLSRYFRNDIENIMNADIEELASVNGVGPVIGESVVKYFQSEEKKEQALRLYEQLRIKKVDEESVQEQDLQGLTFVVTGSVTEFANRNELKEYIEQRGGKVTAAVSGKTDYLINNDNTSLSGKNKKAKELGIPVLTEKDLLEGKFKEK